MTSYLSGTGRGTASCIAAVLTPTVPRKIDWLVVRLIESNGLFSPGIQPVGWVGGWLGGWLVGLLLCWWDGQLASWLVRWLADWLTSKSITSLLDVKGIC